MGCFGLEEDESRGAPHNSQLDQMTIVGPFQLKYSMLLQAL